MPRSDEPLDPESIVDLYEQHGSIMAVTQRVPWSRERVRSVLVEAGLHEKPLHHQLDEADQSDVGGSTG